MSPVARRVAVATCGLLLAAVVLRPAVAGALSARGNDFLRAGDPRSAIAYFARATAFDARSSGIVERYGFVAMETRDVPALRRFVRLAAAVHGRHAPALALNEALALELLGEDRAAARTFAGIGASTHDFRLYALAAHAAHRAGDRADARRWMRQALRLEPRYAPARRYAVQW